VLAFLPVLDGMSEQFNALLHPLTLVEFQIEARILEALKYLA
jgi:hypothetical protein